MAKRKKKLNKKILILLIVLGGVLALGGVAVVVRMLPKDPVAHAERAEKAQAEGDWKQAERLFAIARGASKEAQYSLRFARFQLDRMQKDESLSTTQRQECLGNAMSLLREALRRDPRNVEAQALLEELLWPYALRHGSYDPYIEEADRLLELEPQRHLTVFRRGWSRSRKALANPTKDNIDRAIADLRKAVELAPDRTAYWVELAQFLASRPINRADDAEKVFQQAIMANPASPELHVAYAGLLQRQDKPQDALAQLRQAIASAPDNPIGQLALAEHHLRAKEYDAALDALKAAQAVDETDVRVYHQMARIYRIRKEPQEAAAVIRKGLEVIDRRLANLATATQPAAMESQRLVAARADLNYMLAGHLLDLAADAEKPEQKARLLAEARTCLKALEGLRPGSHQVEKIRGRLALADGDTEAALTHLEAAREKFGRLDAETANLLVNLYLRARPPRPGDAEKIIDEILQTPGQGGNSLAWLMKAKLEWQYRRFARAEAAVDRALRIDPSNQEAQTLKRLLRSVSGDATEVPEGMALTPAVLRTYLERVARLAREGEGQQAVALAETLHAKAPKSLDVLTTLANLYLRTGQKDRAESLLRKAMQDLPDRKEALEFQLKLLNETDPDKRLAMMLEQVDQGDGGELDKLLRKADLHLQFGRGEQYKELIAKAAATDPRDPRVLERQIRMAVAAEDWTEAERLVEVGAEADIDGAGGRLLRSQLAMARRQWADAIALLEAMRSEKPGDRGVLTRLGLCYLSRDEKGDVERAEQVYDAMLASDPGYLPAVVGMARVREAQGKTAEQNELVERAYNLNSRDPYIQKRQLVIEQERALRDEDPAKIARIIRMREDVYRSDPSDLPNAVQLARLYEEQGNALAEDVYRHVYDNAAQKAGAASLLVGYYARTNQSAKADQVLSDLLKKTEDKVAAYILYSEFLSTVNQGEQAMAMMRKAIDADPRDPRPHEGMATLLARMGRWKEAAGALSGYVALKQDDLHARRRLVEYHLQAGDLDAAETALRPVSVAEPTQPETLRLAGLLAAERRDFRKAEQLLTSALRENPRYVAGLLARSMVYRQQGGLSSARDDLATAVRLGERTVDALRLADLERQMGRLGDAERTLLDVLRREPRNLEAIGRLASVYTDQKDWRRLSDLLNQKQKALPEQADLWLLEAAMWRQRGEAARELEALETARRLAPQSVGVAEAHLTALCRQGRYDKALAECDRYDQDAPRLTGLVEVMRGRALAGLDKAAQAKALFETALSKGEAPAPLVLREMQAAFGLTEAIQLGRQWIEKHRPRDWRAQLALADLYLQNEDDAVLKEGLPMMEALPRLAPTDAARTGIYRRLGMAQYRLRDYAAAEESYKQVLAQEPEDLHALNNLAYLYTNETNRPREGLQYAERAVKLRPKDANLLDTYGWTLAQLARSEPSRWDEARKVLQQSVQLEPMAANCYHLGWVLMQQDQKAEAEKWLRRGLEMVRDKPADPLYKKLQDALKEL